VELEYHDTVDAWLPWVFLFVLGLSFVLLTVAFRSIVVSAKAIVLNLLSVGAAYGLLVLVFQKGIGNELFGFEQAEAVEAWVPLFLFSVLFGLSMDYQVFLLSRIRETYVLTADNRRAVQFGIVSTGRLITGAALIIIAVFWGFAMGDLIMFQQMGFGVAVALLIDATIVRSVLVPATMTLLGGWNWYLPSWLSWLPDAHVEGHEEPRRPVPATGS
jgi:RND superfamily putative drug exporter